MYFSNIFSFLTTCLLRHILLQTQIATHYFLNILIFSHTSVFGYTFFSSWNENPTYLHDQGHSQSPHHAKSISPPTLLFVTFLMPLLYSTYCGHDVAIHLPVSSLYAFEAVAHPLLIFVCSQYSAYRHQ